MINREDMLELTRRMTVSRSSITRIAGSYIDSEGYIDGTFNTNFLKLSAKEKQKNLLIAKAIPFSDTNENLKGYHFEKENQKNGSMWQLLQGMRSCGLKNDALMETFYELVSEKYQSSKEYAIFVFHDRYDVPVKATDKERIGESEEVFEYLICAICPLKEEFEPGEPDCGFIFPMFSDRSSDIHGIGIYNKDKDHPHQEITELLFG
ncbi:DUF4317 family protein [Lachnoclostridium phytofermentans]|jgi:hypothetical protein|uniref:DUF4317 family protein n=1 Tax=Lachnoclostridium phytofermentans TaxID=66219 RepID=UPI0004983C50|nr:DUF4317 family protein [Lachnoclostridium phytofermentans]